VRAGISSTRSTFSLSIGEGTRRYRAAIAVDEVVTAARVVEELLAGATGWLE
jgi:hypothetical protein